MIIRKGLIAGVALVALTTGFSVQAAEGTKPDVSPSTGMGRDENAKITKTQFLERAEARFARMDANKDGVLDASDRQQMHARMKECKDMMDGMGMMGGSTGGADANTKKREAQAPQ